MLTRTAEAPSTPVISGLNTEVTEGSLTPFTVTMKVPGVDGKTPQKPRLIVSYDGKSDTAGNSFLELDGSRYVIADLNNKDPQYLEDSQSWKFTLIFDTKNISVQPQLAKDKSVMVNADGTRVRLSIKAASPFGTSSAETLAQVKIRYNKSISAPRFDLSGLAQQALQVAPGEKVTLNYFVISADTQSVVKVEAAKSSLPGSPSSECKSSTAGANIQICTLTWSVPCDAKAEQLTGDVSMTAVSVVNGKNSDVTTYKMKVLSSKEDKKLCPTAEATK